MSKIRFTKMHGCGNDYIYVDTMQYPIADPVQASILWSDRHKGIGSDGLVLIGTSPIPEADYSMRIFNADGSEAMMCGNASRCIGKYLYERGITTQTQIRLLTKSGVKILKLNIAQPLPSEPCPYGVGAEVGVVSSITVDMGEPVLVDEKLFLPNRGLDKGVFVSMGNPHYVIFTDNVDQVGETGRKLELHPAFPRRCNIEFAQVTDSTPNTFPTRERSGCSIIRTRVWERGSGVTQACGTGACATAVAAFITGRASRQSQIVMDGGTLNIELRESDNHVYMTGPAEFVFDGFIELPDAQSN
ncbi:MAG: diaminopimelate epimerase [Prevotella sp.]|nr:diaminopimelate epimerase [Prevotella sp.]